jgi:hypothetical protein
LQYYLRIAIKKLVNGKNTKLMSGSKRKAEDPASNPGPGDKFSLKLAKTQNCYNIQNTTSRCAGHKFLIPLRLNTQN